MKEERKSREKIVKEEMKRGERKRRARGEKEK